MQPRRKLREKGKNKLKENENNQQTLFQPKFKQNLPRQRITTIELNSIGSQQQKLWKNPKALTRLHLLVENPWPKHFDCNR